MARAFDPETVKLIAIAYDLAWRDIEAASIEPLSLAQRTEASAALTKHLLAAVDEGERDPDKLKLIALNAMKAR
ncbi:MAG: hypothetical protein JO172_05070 [Hyphomicrobiales bacterium]|nr:hypothetical protein [Hyphomicrobiales bacterium]